MWTKHARAQCNRWVSAAGHDYVDGSHDGYVSIGVTHRRRLIYLRPNQWVIVDDLTGKGDHHLLQTWHFAREAIVHSEPLGIFRQPTSTKPAIGEPMSVSDRKGQRLPIAPGGMVRVGDVWLFARSPPGRRPAHREPVDVGLAGWHPGMGIFFLWTQRGSAGHVLQLAWPHPHALDHRVTG